MSELTKLCGSKILIVCFAGRALYKGCFSFEFVNHLTSLYENKCDMIFYMDKTRTWYHKGIDGISTSIDETKDYLTNKIIDNNYTKTIFIGVSAGGYAAILFGSLCDVTNVVAFIPQTTLDKPKNIIYKDLKNVINTTTKYLLYGDPLIKNIDNYHNIYHCKHLEDLPNIKVIERNKFHVKHLRDSGEIKNIIDNIIYE